MINLILCVAGVPMHEASSVCKMHSSVVSIMDAAFYIATHSDARYQLEFYDAKTGKRMTNDQIADYVAFVADKAQSKGA